MRLTNSPSTRNLPELESLEDRIVLDASSYVSSLYATVLNRVGSTEEVASWVNYISQGHTSAQVATGFTKSPENLANEVQKDYMTILHRSADAQGLKDGINLLESTSSQTDLGSKLLNSAEYQGTHTTDASFVDSLYSDVLNRSPDSGGQAGWLSVVSNPKNRPAAVKGFLDSPEHIGLTVTALYQDTLHRNPTAQESQTDDSLLSNDQQKYDDLAISLLDSTEYKSAQGFTG